MTSDSGSSGIAVVTAPTPDPGRAWQPVVGEETRGLLSHALEDAATARQVEQAAVSILSRCVPPTTTASSETGLVIGYVQSGKTLSFTAVAALARDNGYHMAVVITGISTNLHQQSTQRLRQDLRLDERRVRRWQLFQNPRNDATTRGALRDVLHGWRDPSVPSAQKQTALITVMKNHQWLANLRDLLRGLDLTGSPVLVIDDEADQASMNTRVRQGDESTTYQRIMEIRDTLPRHSFLQYTATPQAPLLISIIDSLSPRFVEILEPGSGYVGGQDFFGPEMRRYVRGIPPNDIGTDDQPLPEPPESLLHALRMFMVGVAAGLITTGGIGNRSMLVHPSHRTQRHQEYFRWVQQVTDNWKRVFEEDASSPDYQELLDDFEDAYDDLAQTSSDIPPRDAILQRLPYALRQTQILEVNARPGQTPQVPWYRSYGWVLVGGQAMDRGFTVEGLTVTYMPRGIGVRNVDTVQQRGRFFGYKRPYLGYCRIYLEQQVSDAFHSYVEHEENVRGDLEEYKSNGQPLTEWKRAFFLARNLRPTRLNVLSLDYMQGRFSNSWVIPGYPLAPASVIEENRWTISRFLEQLELVPDRGHSERTDIQRHLVCKDIALETALSDLLVQYRLTSSVDSQRNTGLLLQLRRALDQNAEEPCTVYQMSSGSPRRRSINEEGKIITNLFQGAYPVVPRERQGSIYPGDREIRTRDRVTIQVHLVDLTLGENGPVRAGQVPILAVWVPSRLAGSWLVQEERRIAGPGG